MNPRRKKILLVSIHVLIYVIIGFFREFLFLNVNEQLRVMTSRYKESYVDPSMQWISGLSYSTLYISKWLFTFVFTALFAFIASRTIKIAFEDKGLIKLTWIAYAVVFCLGMLFYLIGSLIGNPEATYDLARFLAGLTETPVLLVILSASFLAMGRR
jgi:hypothetical protein